MGDQARGLNGALRCRGSTDPRIRECRGTIRGPAGAPVALLVSLVDGQAAIILLTSALAPEEADAWQTELALAFGEVTPSRQNSQLSWRWIRRGQMLRFTRRAETRGLVASISLIDGPLLDGLGAPKRRGPDSASGPPPDPAPGS